LAETVVVKEIQSFTLDNGVDPVISSHCAGAVPPVILHNNRKLGTFCDFKSFTDGFSIPRTTAFGNGIVRVIGL
ncbi:unnamed protein product, partial [Schistosoma curassoni]|uniref:Laccase n=1 Tax=Schistosoma curassoni TaxID=6186 RepID=A0A183KEY4_9TREM